MTTYIIYRHITLCAGLSDSIPATDEAMVLQLEFKLLAALAFQLVLFHPYRLLVQYAEDAGLQKCIKTAWCAPVCSCVCAGLCVRGWVCVCVCVCVRVL